MPATTNPRPSIRPKVCSIGPRWISGCTPYRVRRALQVPHRIDGRPVDAHLEVQVVAEAVPGAADVADHLALAHARAHRGPVARLVRVAGRERAAVVDARVVAVAAGPAQQHDAAAVGGADRRSRRHGDVDARVQAPPAHAEAGDDRPVDRPDQAARALADRAGRAAALRRLEPGEHRRLLFLERRQVALQITPVVPRGRERPRLHRAGALELLLAVDEAVLDRVDLRGAPRDLGGDLAELLLERVEPLLGGDRLRLRLAHAVDDARVLLRDALHELGARLGEPLAQPRQVDPLAPQLVLYARELGALVGEVGLDPHLARLQDVDVAFQNVDPPRVARDRRREHALAALLLLDRALLRLDPARERRAVRQHGHEQPEAERHRR